MSKLSLARILALLLSLITPLALRADTKVETKVESKIDTKDAKSDKDDAKDEKSDEPVLSVTAHSLTLNGHVIKYHATAGYIILKEEEGKPLVPGGGGSADSDKSKDDDKKSKDGLKSKARIFFVAYTLDDVKDPATRPLTFCFNGGPGSASIWLHMGAMAPRRAALTPEGEAPPPPYQLVDNESTWLDRTDLVFIDPVSTGFSRAFPKESPSQFHGLKEDIASIGDFIRLYTTRNDRWLSPKIVLGESYGTTRAAGLSDYLQDRYQLYLNGIVLVSSVINFQTIDFTPQNNDPYVDFLPSFATSAWYHQKLAPDLQAKSVAEVADLARAFAGHDYMLALARGDTLPDADKQHIASELSRFTSLPAAYYLRRRLRVSDFLFFTQLLRDENKMLGRLDARFSGARYEPGTDNFDYDPSDEATNGPLTAAFNDYVRRELKFETDIPYEGLTDVGPWNYGDARGGHPNTAEDLRRAMSRNPYLKVWVTCSYYDLATPFYGAELAVAAMNLDPAIRSNLKFTYYEAGHMLYIHQASRTKFKTDFESFLQDATHQQPVHSAAR